jgi:hypothetical protein
MSAPPDFIVFQVLPPSRVTFSTRVPPQEAASPVHITEASRA